MPDPPRHGRAARLQIAALGLAVVAVAAGARILPELDRRAASGAVVVSDPDAAYHLRRAERIRDGFPTLARFDPFVAAPQGATIPWPPLWDLALAGVLTFAPSEEATGFVDPAVAALPPLVAGLGALAVFCFARRLFPGRLDLAALAGLFAALVPADRPWTGFAQLDHTAAELALFTLFGAALARGLAAASEGAALDRRAVPAGIVLAAGIAIQAALVVTAAVPALAIALLPRERGRSGFAFLATLWGTAALAAGALAALDGSLFAAPRMISFGSFQPALLAAAALVAVAGATALAKRHVVAAAFALLSLAAFALLARETLAGLGFLGRTSPWVATIGESRSLFAGSLGAGLFALARTLSWGLVALPIGLVALVARARRDDGAAAAAAALVASGTALAFAQARFVGHLAWPLGLAAAAALAPLAHRRAAAARAGVVVIALLALVLPATLAGPDPPEAARQELERSWPVLVALRERAAGLAESERPVVLAEWSFGHFVEYYGRHPAAVDNFGDAVADLDLPRRVLLATDRRAAERALDAAGVGLVLVGELAPTLNGLLPTTADQERFIEASAPAPDGTLAIRFRPAILETVLYRAARQLGASVVTAGGAPLPPLDGWRLVAVSDAAESLPGGVSRPSYKLFERVPGARLVAGGLPPGAAVQLEAELELPTGENLGWFDAATADSAGRAVLRFPYATAGEPVLRPLVVSLAAGEAHRDVRDIPFAAVRAGGEVTSGDLPR